MHVVEQPRHPARPPRTIPVPDAVADFAARQLPPHIRDARCESWAACVILTQNGIQLVELDHTSEAKAFEHVRMGLRSGADTARVMQWSDGRWWHFETMHASDIPQEDA